MMSKITTQEKENIDEKMDKVSLKVIYKNFPSLIQQQKIFNLISH